jgi:hypothetical protein
LGERFHGVDSVAAVLKYTPEVREFQHGANWLLFVPPFTFVPRAVWDEKPVAFNQDFAPTYFGRDYFTDVHIAVFAVSDLYMNFAWPGLLLGAVLLGAMFRFVYEYLIVRSQRSDVGVFLYGLFFVQLANIELELATPLSQCVKSLPFLLALVWFMRLRVRLS